MNKSTDKQYGINADEKRRRLTFYFISYVGSTIVLTFALKNLGGGNQLLETLLFGGATLILINVLLSHRYPNSKVFYFIGGSLVIGFIFGLVFTGGYKNTGLYWVYPFYPVILMLIGYRLGIAITITSLILITYLLYQPGMVQADYAPEQISRFLASLVTFISIIFIGEYFWHKSHMEMATDNLEKQRLANTDPLTKLLNRRFLDSVYFERALLNPVDYYPLCIVAMDIDYFKKINDSYGHDVGDKVLVYLSGLMKSAVRKADIVVRTGGEEFLILYPVTNLSVGISLAETICQKIAKSPFKDGKLLIDLSASFGVATALTDVNLNAAMKLADENLYLAKQKGRNRVV